MLAQTVSNKEFTFLLVPQAQITQQEVTLLLLYSNPDQSFSKDVTLLLATLSPDYLDSLQQTSYSLASLFRSRFPTQSLTGYSLAGLHRSPNL